MKINEAKKIIKKALEDRSLDYTKLTGKTIDFTDLLRRDAIFITIHGWKPNPKWSELKEIAKQNDFCIDADNSVWEI